MSRGSDVGCSLPDRSIAETGGAVSSWAADPLAMDGADIPPPVPVTELAGAEPDGEPD